MGTKDPRVDAYIAKSADFARPILERLRALVHAGCPNVEETMKWNSPHFMHHGMLCGMAAFQKHCAFGFWNSGMNIPHNLEAMGQFGRITALSDLPEDRVTLQYVREAARLNESGIKHPPRPKHVKKAISMPADLRSALKKIPRARATFEGLSPSNRRDYLEWITEAKRADTRKKRLETAIAWMAEGKPKNWKYMARPSGTERSRTRASRA
jgi:uncharacterized protein YdeI (YjbR/CyaY-like superfamily)